MLIPMILHIHDFTLKQSHSSSMDIAFEMLNSDKKNPENQNQTNPKLYWMCMK